MKFANNTDVDIVVSYSEEAGVSSGKKRQQRAVNNAISMLDTCIEQKSGDFKLYANLQGGNNPDLRKECSMKAMQRNCDGFYIGGMHDFPNFQSRKEIIDAAIEPLDDREKILGGNSDPVDILYGFLNGINSFESSYPFTLKTQALYFDDFNYSSEAIDWNQNYS